MAAEPGGVRLFDQQPKFDGGLNDVSDDATVAPNQMRRAVNGRLTDYGAVTKRGGTQRTSMSALAAAPVLNGYTWTRDSGTPQVLAICNGALRTATYGTFPLTWASPTGTLATTGTPSFAQFRDTAGADVVYIADGGLLNKWDGTTLSTNLTNTVAVTEIAVYNQRLWGAGNSSFPDSVFYSALDNGDTLGYGAGGGGQIIVRTFGDEPVVGLAAINTSLLIFHRRGISRLTGYGQDDLTVAPQAVTADVGTIAPQSIVASGNIAYFVTERGLYQCNEAEVAPLGTPTTPDPLLPIIRQLTATQLAAVRSVINRATKELWITIPGFGCYQYHTVLQAWSGPWDGGYVDPDTTCLFETLDASGLPVILKGDASGWVSLCDAPYVFKDNVLGDGTGGARYALTAQLHRFYFGDDALAKSFRWGYLTAQLKGSAQCRIEWNSGATFGSFSLPPSTDETWGGAGTVWGTGTWGGAGSQSYRIPMGGTGYYVDFSIIDSGEALPVFSRFQAEAFSLSRR
jgi:hypothetical protein